MLNTTPDTPPPTRWLDDEAQDTWRVYIRGSQRLLEVLNRELSEVHGSSLQDYRILVVLSEAPGGALRMSELAEGLASSRSRLTHQIRRLEEAGVVRREDAASDRRGVMAVITDAGRARLATMAPTHVDGVRRYLVDDLDAQDRSALWRIFSRVEERLGEQSGTRY